jgi:hypothetical protein
MQMMKLADGSTVKFSKIARMVAKANTADQEVDQRVRKLMRESGEKSYSRCMKVVLDVDKPLAKRWLAQSRGVR